MALLLGSTRRDSRIPLGVAGQDALVGIRGDYYEMAPRACETRYSNFSLQGRVPNYTRIDRNVNFFNIKAFNVKKCWYVWESGRIPGNDEERPLRKSICRGHSEFAKNFAARWTGSLKIRAAGVYEFELRSDDGARLWIGHNDCPGPTCGTQTRLENARAEDYFTKPTAQWDGSYARRCEYCGGNDAGKEGPGKSTCWTTMNGCEPFSIWLLDNTKPFCQEGYRKRNSTRYLSRGEHPVRVEYYQWGPPEGIMRWLYRGPDTSGEMIAVPANALVPEKTSGLRADWFDFGEKGLAGLDRLPHLDSEFAVARFMKTEIRLDVNELAKVDMGDLARITDELNHDVAIRYSGQLVVKNPGTYTFSVTSDDGSRLYIREMGGGYRLVIDNDGLKVQMERMEADVVMAPGLHALKLEYFYRHLHDKISRSVAGVLLEYSGPDTGNATAILNRKVEGALTTDVGCTQSQWSLQGLMQNKDCKGKCFDGRENTIGDRYCDGGTNPVYDFMCEGWNFDNGDCEIAADAFTTPKPQYLCYDGCPTGEFREYNCDRCRSGPPQLVNGKQQKERNYCVEAKEEPQWCKSNDAGGLDCYYQKCCSAKVYGDPVRGDHCIMFGSATANCGFELNTRLKAWNDRWLGSLNKNDLEKATEEKRFFTAELLVECEGDRCNYLPRYDLLDPSTGAPTGEKSCYTPKEKPAGVECFIGPWEQLEIGWPLEMCQELDDQNRIDFCLDRRQRDAGKYGYFHERGTGRPFGGCCLFGFRVTATGQGSCRAVGVPSGVSCPYYLLKMGRDRYAMPEMGPIEDGVVLADCAEDRCNDPEEFGCAVVRNPEKTKANITWNLRRGPGAGQDGGLGGKDEVWEQALWGVLGGLGGLVFLACLRHAMLHWQEKEEQREHDKRHGRPPGSYVVTDVWVEPAKSEEHQEEMAFKLVRPTTPDTQARNAAKREAKLAKSEGLRSLAWMAHEVAHPQLPQGLVHTPEGLQKLHQIQDWADTLALARHAVPGQLPPAPSEGKVVKLWQDSATIEASSSATDEEEMLPIPQNPALPPPVIGAPDGATSFDPRLAEHAQITVKTQLACRPPAISRLERQAHSAGLAIPTRVYSGRTVAT